MSNATHPPTAQASSTSDGAGYWLSMRIGIPAALILFAALLTFFSLQYNTRIAYRAVEKNGVEDLTRAMTRLQSTVEFLMQRNELERVRSELVALGTQASIHTALLIDDKQRVLASFKLADIGKPLADVLPSATGFAGDLNQAMHDVRSRLSGKVVLNDAGEAVRGLYPIVLGADPGALRPNREGILFVQQDLVQERDIQHHQVQQQALQFGGFLVLLAGMLWLFLHLGVTRRTNRLLTAVGHLAAGDLGTRVALGGGDEFARIGAAFDDMAANLQDQRRRLAESGEQLALALNASGQGLWDLDLATGDALFSAEYAHMLGHEAQEYELSLSSWTEQLHPEDREATLQAFNNYVSGLAADFDVEFRMRTHSGEWIWIQSMGKIVEHDADGRPVRMVGTHMDITERKAAEEALQLTQFAVDQSRDGVFLVDAQGCIIRGNDQACRNLGCQQEELIGIHIWEFDQDFSQADWLPLFARMRREGAVIFETRHRRKDGSTLPVEISASYIRFGDKEYGFSFARDISERKRAEEALRRLNEELEERVEQRTAELSLAKAESERANLAKSEFLSRMSHELRTPLNAILGFGQLLELEIREVEQADNVQEIMHAGQHLLELINEVLDLARIESGKFTISQESVPLLPLIEECLTLIRPLAETRDIRFVETGRDCAGHVLADRTRLKQVLLNLLSNAVKYNRVQGTVGIACVVDGDSVQIRISDSGPGLTPEQQGRLFVAFERLSADQSGVEGTGIGLALSKRLTELMGGQIGVESAPGQGSTFWVRMPITDAHPGATAETEVLEVPARVAGHSQFDVLCIEDNPANLRLIERILARRADIRLLSASAPGLGLELAVAYKPALILLDINLPDMDGYEVMQCLRESAVTRDIPVVAISANAMAKDLARGKAAGFVEYLTKPLNVVRFNSVVDDILKSTVSAALPTGQDMK